jgi:hypothetical protein
MSSREMFVALTAIRMIGAGHASLVDIAGLIAEGAQTSLDQALDSRMGRRFPDMASKCLLLSEISRSGGTLAYWRAHQARLYPLFTHYALFLNAIERVETETGLYVSRPRPSPLSKPHS